MEMINMKENTERLKKGGYTKTIQKGEGMLSSGLHYNTIMEMRRIHYDTAEWTGVKYLFNFFNFKYVHVHHNN